MLHKKFKKIFSSLSIWLYIGIRSFRSHPQWHLCVLGEAAEHNGMEPFPWHSESSLQRAHTWAHLWESYRFAFQVNTEGGEGSENILPRILFPTQWFYKYNYFWPIIFLFPSHRVTLFSTRMVFDPSQYAGLPLNIMALMPVLVHHFDQPTPFCVNVVSNIQQVLYLILLQ